MWLLSLVACELLDALPDLASIREPAVVEVVVEAPPAPPQSTERFVLASRLNLRAAPDPKARSLGRLDINSPVEPVESRDGWAKVRTRNGKEGWLSERFLVPERVTVASAAASAAVAGEPDEALSWWQRAAALEPMDQAVLTGLAAAYRAAGDERTAARVERQLGWPETMFLVPETYEHGPAVEWTKEVDYAGFDYGGDSNIPRGEWSKWGVDADEGWHVLPDWGAAVSATVGGVRYAVLNECGGTVGVMVDLAYTLPEGRVPLAAVRGTPPPSWRIDTPAPAVSRDAALAAVTAVAKSKGYFAADEFNRVAVAPDGDGWIGRAAWLPEGTPADDGAWWPPLKGVDVRVDAAGAASLVAERDDLDSLGIQVPVGRRDVTGDGQRETVWESGCHSLATRDDGTTVAVSEFRCCGC